MNYEKNYHYCYFLLQPTHTRTLAPRAASRRNYSAALLAPALNYYIRSVLPAAQHLMLSRGPEVQMGQVGRANKRATPPRDRSILRLSSRLVSSHLLVVASQPTHGLVCVFIKQANHNRGLDSRVLILSHFVSFHSICPFESQPDRSRLACHCARTESIVTRHLI